MAVRPPNTTEKVSFGIGAKMALLLCSVVAWATVGGGVWTYLRFSEKLVQDELSRQSLMASSVESQFLEMMRNLREDVASVATTPAVTGLLRAQSAGGIDPVSGRAEASWRESLETLFRQTLARRADYFQVRLIGTSNHGREIVRVERQDDTIQVVAKERLQQKGHRPYFKEAIVLSPGEIYVSDLELNKEYDRVVVPHVPVVSAAVPIYVTAESAQAIVIINADLRPLLRRFGKMLAGRYDLYLFDAAGRFLVHPNSHLQLGLQVGGQGRVTDEFPDLQVDVDHSDSQGVVEHSPTGQKVVADLRRLSRDSDPDHNWGLLLTGDYAAAITEQDSLRTQIIGWGSTLLALTLATVMVFSRSLTGPLRQITRAVEEFRRGGTRLELPLDARDEAGVLARAFDEMSREVLEHDAEMRREMTVRRQAERALQETERQLRLALDAAEAGVWIWDLENNFTYRDKTAAEILGLPPGDHLDRRWTERLHPDDGTDVERKLQQARRQSETFDAEFRLSDVHGFWKYVKARAISVLGDNKQPVKLIGVCWDVSREKAVQDRMARYADELKRKNDELEQFVYSVSHDLKSPLVTCKGYLGLLREDLQDGNIDQALDSALRMEGAADYMRCLIEDLLELSRAGGDRAVEETVDVANLVRTVLEQCRKEVSVNAVDVHVDPGIPSVSGDPSALRSLFQNLIGNAFKYGCVGSNPRIEIGGVKDAGETRFFVRDYGPGIAAEYQEKIFRLFQRLDTSQEGTGIGLAIIKKIVDSRGGRVWVESEAGKGATFWVAFPQHAVNEFPSPVGKVLL